MDKFERMASIAGHPFLYLRRSIVFYKKTIEILEDLYYNKKL